MRTYQPLAPRWRNVAALAACSIGPAALIWGWWAFILSQLPTQ